MCAEPATPIGDSGDAASPAGAAQAFERARRGDARALDAVLRPLAPVVLSAARRVLRSYPGADAEDVAQESLISVARALPRVEAHASLPAYAVRTAVRNAMRARKRARERVGQMGPLDALERIPAADDSPERGARRRRQCDALLHLLDEIPDKQAEALFLRVALGQSLGEVADTVGAPLNTVRSRVRLATRALQDKIEKRPGLRALLEQ